MHGITDWIKFCTPSPHQKAASTEDSCNSYALQEVQQKLALKLSCLSRAQILPDLSRSGPSSGMRVQCQLLLNLLWKEPVPHQISANPHATWQDLFVNDNWVYVCCFADDSASEVIVKIFCMASQSMLSWLATLHHLSLCPCGCPADAYSLQWGNEPGTCRCLTICVKL